jgi:hypothetical protein
MSKFAKELLTLLIGRERFSVKESEEAIAAFIKSNAPHVARIGLETGGNVDVAVDRVK